MSQRAGLYDGLVLQELARIKNEFGPARFRQGQFEQAA
jgi:hypothetical protein